MAPNFPTQTSDDTLKQTGLVVSDVVEDVPCHLSSTKEDTTPQRVSESRNDHKFLDLYNKVRPNIDGETTRTLINRGENGTAPIDATLAKQISTYMDEHGAKYGYIISDQGPVKLVRATSGPSDGIEEAASDGNTLIVATVD
jgi:hypothetical protein